MQHVFRRLLLGVCILFDLRLSVVALHVEESTTSTVFAGIRMENVHWSSEEGLTAIVIAMPSL